LELGIAHSPRMLRAMIRPQCLHFVAVVIRCSFASRRDDDRCSA
jgi:hypothetical protein